MNPSSHVEVAPYAHSIAPVCSGEVHLTFVPDWREPRFLLWGKAAEEQPLSSLGAPGAAHLFDEELQPRQVSGFSIPILAVTRALAAVPTDALERLPPSVAMWSLAAKLLLELVARERVVPRVVATSPGAANVAAKANQANEARFGVALSLLDDTQRVGELAKNLPLAAHAVVAAAGNSHSPTMWRADAALHAYLDMAADALVRAAAHRSKLARDLHRNASTGEEQTWSRRWLAALVQSDGRGAPDKRKRAVRSTRTKTPRAAQAGQGCAHFAVSGFAERRLIEELQAWAQPVLGGAAALPRICFRLELPDAEQPISKAPSFQLRFFLQALDDPSVLVSATDVLSESADTNALHCEANAAAELLLKSLAAAARIFAPIEKSLRQARPDAVLLNAEQAAEFLTAAAPALSEAGMGVILPGELTVEGQRRLRMRMRVGGPTKSSRSTSATGVSLDRLALEFRWEAELNGEVLTADDLAELAALKSPLVRYRGRWVTVEREQLAYAQKMLEQVGGTLTRTAALAAALGGSSEGHEAPPSMPVTVVAEGELSTLLESLRAPEAQADIAQPVELRGELRPYQQRGLAWLATMEHIHVGACLADDMGLGKSIQFLSFLLHRKESRAAGDSAAAAPVLLVCPTSVIGNWQREIARFAPTLSVYAHYGVTRTREASALRGLSADTIVLTSYGLLRRDAAMLGEISWSVAALDEAQNIKNAASRTARAARGLTAGFRIALTGTPMENRLTELWSIMEFLNPGLLGSFEKFRREIAVPIERFAREDIAMRLKHIVRPLILRRVKSDPTVIQDLPSKQEMTVSCSLTREQASLYRAALDEAMSSIEGSEGIERRGQVLALMTALKQICNHPAQYLHEAGPLPNRSGKLERLREMLEETLATDDRVLVFTQYREMGSRLVRELTRRFGHTVQYLHGGTPRLQRDLMIQRFQEDPHGPRIFVLSLKAGGTGLNLTAATHVFHYDRWWNPAVEDQATDRAYRIGQRRNVQVHKFLCGGTIEERVAAMLESKRDLAARIVGQGEQWITELDNTQLRELFSLAPNAVVESDEIDSGDDLEAPRAQLKRKRIGRRPRKLTEALA